MSVNSESEPSPDVFRIKNLSDHHRRKYLKTRDVALVPQTSLNRFKESFLQSKVPDSIKQRLTSFNKSRDSLASSSSGRPPDTEGGGTFN